MEFLLEHQGLVCLDLTLPQVEGMQEWKGCQKMIGFRNGENIAEKMEFSEA
jgi:hypothetical protein